MDFKKKLGGVAASANVGTQMNTGDLVVSHVLDGRPVVGVEQDLVPQPIRNGLLFESRSPHELRQLLGQRRLATGDADSALECSNVRFLHNPAPYTNGFVPVNNPVCVTPDKAACIVISMDHARSKKKQKQPATQRIAVPGPDGKTLGQRVTEAMAYKSGRNGRTYQQVDLIRDVIRIARLPALEQDQRLQQRISAIMTNKVSESFLAGAIAAACDVDHLWLGYGVGKMLKD